MSFVKLVLHPICVHHCCFNSKALHISIYDTKQKIQQEGAAWLSRLLCFFNFLRKDFPI